MDTDRDPPLQGVAKQTAGGGPATEAWVEVDGPRIAPATGSTITVELIQELIDEDRERHLPDAVPDR